MAFRKGFKEARPVLLEPLYEVEVMVPEEHMGDVMGDLSSRRGKILGMDSDSTHRIIRELVPLKELVQVFYDASLNDAGTGIHKQKFSHYEEVPHEVAVKIIEEYEKSKGVEERPPPSSFRQN